MGNMNHDPELYAGCWRCVVWRGGHQRLVSCLNKGSCYKDSCMVVDTLSRSVPCTGPLATLVSEVRWYGSAGDRYATGRSGPGEPRDTANTERESRAPAPREGRPPAPRDPAAKRSAIGWPADTAEGTAASGPVVAKDPALLNVVICVNKWLKDKRKTLTS